MNEDLCKFISLALRFYKRPSCTRKSFMADANARCFVNYFSLSPSAILDQIYNSNSRKTENVTISIFLFPFNADHIPTSFSLSAFSKLMPSGKNFQRKFHKPHTDTPLQYDNVQHCYEEKKTDTGEQWLVLQQNSVSSATREK